MQFSVAKMVVAIGMLSLTGTAAAYGVVNITTYDTYKEMRGYYNVRYNPYIDPSNVRVGTRVHSSGQVVFEGRDEEGDMFYCSLANDGSDFYKYAYDVALHAGNGSYITVRTPNDGSGVCSFLELVNSSSYMD